MKIIILEHEPFTERKRKHYFVNEFINDDYLVEYWDIREALNYIKGVEYTHFLEEPFIKRIDSIDGICLEILKQNPQKVIFIIELWFTVETRKIFEILEFKSFRWVRLDYYLNPTNCFDAKETYIDKLRKIKFLRLSTQIKNFVFSKINNNQNNYCPDILFATGSSTNLLPCGKKYVALNYFDVQEHKEAINEDPILSYDYMVFLDIMILNHPDFKRVGFRKDLINSTYYFEKMSFVFSRLEELYGIPVVIASHPKANYTNEFGGRLCIRNVTANLVVNSKKVLTHGSLSISYALLSNKELIYLDFSKSFGNNFALKRIQNRMYKAVADLDCNIIDVEKSDISFTEKPINEKAYLDFLFNYYLVGYLLDNYQMVKESIEEL